MTRRSSNTRNALLVGLVWLLPLGCSDGDTFVTSAVPPAPPQPGPSINAATASPEELAALDVVSSITRVTIASAPVVEFTVGTSSGIPIVGVSSFWESDPSFIRFTITKLVRGRNGDPDSWVAYVRDNGEPDYDTGASIVDHNDGSYSFTFNTDVTNVPGVAYQPNLTHRVAGQIGSSSVPLEPQNLWRDFVPAGGPVTHTRNIAVMKSCNECHDDLVFHGRRFEVEYCVQCHNPDLAQGEGDFSFMMHRIHSAGEFHVARAGSRYTAVTYPGTVGGPADYPLDCRKCHDVDDVETPQADNWRSVPHMTACAGCHDNFGPNAKNKHSSPIPQTSNKACALCHTLEAITEAHTSPNLTPNNPELVPGQRHITYELIEATVDPNNYDVTIQYRILSDGQPIDVNNAPADLINHNDPRYPGLILAYALPQGPISEPADYNNMGNRSGLPISLGLDDFGPIAPNNSIGTMTFDPTTGIMTVTITDPASRFPPLASLRAVGLQGYFRQDIDGDGTYDVALHAISAVTAVTGDDARRTVVDNASCASCHEWFEGHGGNRVYNMAICTLCHVPNLSSSGRAIVTPRSSLVAQLGSNPLVYPEDSQNFRDLIHGIHSSGIAGGLRGGSPFRTRPFEFVRGDPRQGYYDWSSVTFPRGADTNNCELCHLPGTYELPLDSNLLPSTVRTTKMANGQDDPVSVQEAFDDVPNTTDWVNTPTATSCFYCHTDSAAWSHMMLNGGLVSVPPYAPGGPWTNRSGLINNVESCVICHGPGRVADITVVHNR